MTAPPEAELVRIFAEVLKLEQVRADDGFFDVGGDSVLALQVVARAREAGLGLSVRDVFNQQTAALLASVAVPLADASAMAAPAGAAVGDDAEPGRPLVSLTADELGEFEDDEPADDDTQQATDVNLGWETVT
jgi:hypothetical protein